VSETFFSLDPSVFPDDLSLASLERIFRHLKGVDSTTMDVSDAALRFTEGAPVTKILLQDAMLLPGLLEVSPNSSLTGDVALATISDFVRPKDSEEDIKKLFKGKVPSDEVRIRTLLKQKKDLMVLMCGKLVLVTTTDAIRRMRGNRWVFNLMRTGKHYVLMDARIVDEYVPESAFADIPKLIMAPEVKATKRALEAARDPLFLSLVDLEKFVLAGDSASTRLLMRIRCSTFETVGRDDPRVKSLHMVFKNGQESFKSAVSAARSVIGEFEDSNPLYMILKDIIPKELSEFKRAHVAMSLSSTNPSQAPPGDLADVYALQVAQTMNLMRTTAAPPHGFTEP
jgi:hypothetical protein